MKLKKRDNTNQKEIKEKDETIAQLQRKNEDLTLKYNDGSQ